MNDTKESGFAFDGTAKESFKNRLKELIGTRSIRSVAKAWGLSFSTLNNYLNRGTEPSLSALKVIADSEKVSLDWLVSGNSPKTDSNKNHEVEESDALDSDKRLSAMWLMILDSIDTADAKKLIRAIHQKGIQGILAAQEAEPRGLQSEIDNTWMNLPIDEKQRLLALHEAKKGTFESGELDIPVSPESMKKQAS